MKIQSPFFYFSFNQLGPRELGNKGLPSHFLQRDDTMTLIHENGEECQTIYLARKTGLSGGCKKFVVDHDLVDGDALVFQSTRPTVFKVEDLKQFRQWGSKSPGHLENFETPGTEVATGPLGQGIANGVGLALAEKHLAARYNKPDNEIVDHYTYVILGDGCQMEGILNEACSLAGHWGLGKLITFYDDNHISIDGDTEIAFTENVDQRFEALGWHVIWVKNGNTGYDEIRAAIKEAKAVTDKPTLIKVTTTIGFGSPNKASSYRVLKVNKIPKNKFTSTTSLNPGIGPSYDRPRRLV